MRAGAGCPTTCPVSSAERAVAVGKVARAPGILRSTARMRVLKNLALERKTHARISRDCVEASRVVRGFESRDPRPSSGARQRTITRSETSLHSTATFAFCVQSVSLRELAAHDHHPGHAKHGDKEECRPPPRRGPSADADGLLGGRCALGEQGEGDHGWRSAHASSWCAQGPGLWNRGRQRSTRARGRRNRSHNPRYQTSREHWLRIGYNLV